MTAWHTLFPQIFRFLPRAKRWDHPLTGKLRTTAGFNIVYQGVWDGLRTLSDGMISDID